MACCPLRGSRILSVGLIAPIFIVGGFYIFVGGTYASIQSIIDSYAAGSVGFAFPSARNN